MRLFVAQKCVNHAEPRSSAVTWRWTDARRRRSRNVCRHAPSGGFTLVEVMFVVLLIGILAALAISSYRSFLDRANFARAVFDVGAISSQISRYAVDYGAFPGNLKDVGADGILDPWGHPYQYVNHDSPHTRGLWRRDKNIVPLNSDFDLFSAGKDGASRPPLTAAVSRDDIVRASDGAFIGLASDYDP